jgi:pimeloyl-ACP methyl ester carboxylesterase
VRFLLVHGAFHAGWCWERVIPELNSLGHDAVAPDLPGHDSRRSEEATLDTYRDAVLKIMKPGDVLVGHSQAGTVISAVVDVAPTNFRHLIYLAAPVPAEGTSLADAVAETGGLEAIPGVQSADDEFWFDDEVAAREQFYGDCSREDQLWAFEKLQPQALSPQVTPVHFTNFWTCMTPRSYITCLADKTVVPHTVEATLDRLRIHVAFPFWASHSPFISRPKDLAELFHEIVTRPIGANPDAA